MTQIQKLAEQYANHQYGREESKSRGIETHPTAEDYTVYEVTIQDFIAGAKWGNSAEWIDLRVSSNMPPKLGVRVLGHRGKSQFVCCRVKSRVIDGLIIWRDDNGQPLADFEEPTHWQPLPPDPPTT